MDKSVVWVLFFLLFLFIVFFIPNFVLGGVINSTYDFFNVTNITEFNWTTSIIFVGSYNNTITVNINNITTGLYPDYTQTDGESGNYPNTWQICFPEYLAGSNNISFVIQNQTGFYTNYTSVMNKGEVENFILFIHLYCPPGRYSGYFTLTRVGNASDKANVLATIDVPLSINNTFDLTDNSAYFKGTMEVNDSYHSYYFNTSEIPENITGFSVKLIQLTDDIDLFLFDESGNLRGKSIKGGSSNEEIIDIDLPPSPEMWEFRVYGNISSSYRGNLYFSTLNTSKTSLNFGVFGPNNTGSESFTLTNEDDRALMNVNEYHEVYHVDVWNTDNISKDITNLFVPNFTKKLKVKIEWTDETGKEITDWNLYLTDPSGNLIGSSTDKFFNSNTTSATREEYVVYSGPFNSNNEGFWNISMRNTTNSSIPLSYYNVTAYIWMDETAWISTNYTNGFDFNSSEVGNYTYDVKINLTIPETQILDGKYEGYIKYNNTEGWNTRLPISFNVSVGTLVINNTFNSVTRGVKENIGFNRLGSSALTMDITYNNTGSLPIWYVNTTSNYTLTNDDKNITFSVSNWPSNPINPGTSGVMTITFYINTTLTGNDDGVYSGWVLFNTTNTNLNSSSYPYKTFTLNLEVNLTDELDVRVENIITADGDNQIGNPSQSENITFVTRVYLVNGTQLVDLNDAGFGITKLGIKNFTSASLIESHGGPQYTLTNINQTSSPGVDGWLCYGTPVKCYVNATTPTGIVGGWYHPKITVQWNNSQSLLTGTGSYNYLYVNNTGLKMEVITPVTKVINLDEGTTHYTYFNISVINYGMRAPDGNLSMDNCAYATIQAIAVNHSNCYWLKQQPPGERSFTFDRVLNTRTIDPNGTEACEFSWKITAVADVTIDRTCSHMKIVASDPDFGDITEITINIEDKNASSTTTTSSSDATGTTAATTGTTTSTTTTSTTIPPYLDITSSPNTVSVEQGKSKTESVGVKNTNETISQTVTLSLLYINSSWYNIPTPSKVIGKEQTSTFTVNFTIPNDAKVDDYDGKFNASSSRKEVFKPFTLTVTPGAEMKSEINSSLSDYQTQLDDLEKEIENLEAKGYNTSEAEAVWDSLRIKINNAVTLMDSDDYKGAYDLFDDIESLLNQTRTAIMEAPVVAGDWWSWGKWVVIGGVGAGAAFLGYLFWPTPEGYAPKKVYAQKQKIEGIKEKFTERYKKLKDSWKKIREEKKKTSYFPKRGKK